MGKASAVSIEIRAPAGDIWPYLTELDLLRQWVPRLASIDIDGDSVEVGVRTKETYRLHEKESEFEGQFTRFEPQRAIEGVVDVPGAPTMSRCVLEERDGTTTVTWEYERIDSTLRRRLSDLLVRRFILLDAKEALQRLKQSVEAPSVPLEPIESTPRSQSFAVALLFIAIPLVVAVVQSIFLGGTGLPLWQIVLLFLGGFLILYRLARRGRIRRKRPAAS